MSGVAGGPPWRRGAHKIPWAGTKGARLDAPCCCWLRIQALARWRGGLRDASTRLGVRKKGGHPAPAGGTWAWPEAVRTARLWRGEGFQTPGRLGRRGRAWRFFGVRAACTHVGAAVQMHTGRQKGAGRIPSMGSSAAARRLERLGQETDGGSFGNGSRPPMAWRVRCIKWWLSRLLVGAAWGRRRRRGAIYEGDNNDKGSQNSDVCTQWKKSSPKRCGG
jgi:hypothetical protein